jgi:hypothetical protein
MEKLLDFGIESVFVGASSNQDNYLPKGFKAISLGGNTFYMIVWKPEY